MINNYILISPPISLSSTTNYADKRITGISTTNYADKRITGINEFLGLSSTTNYADKRIELPG